MTTQRKLEWSIAGFLVTLILGCAVGGLGSPHGLIVPFLYGVLLLLTQDSTLRRIGMTVSGLSAFWLGAFLFGEWRIQREGSYARVRAYLGCLVDAAERYRSDRGYYPAGGHSSIVAELLGLRTGAVAYLDLPSDWVRHGTQVVDVWGSPVAFSVNGARFLAMSAGPDKVLRTRDDICVVTTNTANHAVEGTAR